MPGVNGRQRDSESRSGGSTPPWAALILDESVNRGSNPCPGITVTPFVAGVCRNRPCQVAQGGQVVCKTIVSDTIGSIPILGTSTNINLYDTR